MRAVVLRAAYTLPMLARLQYLRGPNQSARSHAGQPDRNSFVFHLVDAPGPFPRQKGANVDSGERGGGVGI